VVSEARALLTEQVDLHRGHIDIIWSKGNRSRRLPLTGQVVDVLTACQQASGQHFPSRRTFFISAAGNQVGTGQTANPRLNVNLGIIAVLLIPRTGSLAAKGFSRRRHVFDDGHERLVTAAARAAPSWRARCSRNSWFSVRRRVISSR
jgi:hypothetical protein